MQGGREEKEGGGGEGEKRGGRGKGGEKREGIWKNRGRQGGFRFGERWLINMLVRRGV